MNLHADYLSRLLARRCSEAAGTMPRLDGMTFAQYRAARGHEWRPYVSAHALNRRRAELRALAYSRIDMADVRDSPSSEVGG